MKRVLITGASNGIGKSIAEFFYQKGYYVIGTGKRESAKVSVHQYISCDLSIETQLEDLMDRVDEIDILINNAGINPISNFVDISFDQFLEVQTVNLFAPFKLCKRYVPHMQKQKWGRIVNICSIWSKKSKIGRASYSASKFGLNGMSIALSHEVSKDNVLVNCVSPGFIDTDLTRINMGDKINSIIEQVPINRLGKPEEIAQAVFWLGSDQNTFITGQNIMIDGGFALV